MFSKRRIFWGLLMTLALGSHAWASDTFIVEQLEINGLTRTKEDVVLRDLEFTKGDNITEEKLKLDQKTNYDLQFRIA